MKTLYLKTTMKVLRLLPVLIFFMLALSYTARSQTVAKTPLCYGEPIQLLCNFPAGCDNQFATFHWENYSGSWTSSERDPIIYPPGSVQNPLGIGYASDRFYLSMQYAPPPGGFYGGRVVVTVLQPIVITGTTTPAICYGTPTGTITLTVTGGKIPYTYLWSNGSTVKNQTGLTSGSYTVTVTDGNLCTQVSSEFVITESSTQLELTGTTMPVSCYEGSDGEIDITPSGGHTPYTYLWSNNATTEDLTGLTSGLYSVTVTDADLCTTVDTYWVSEPETPVSVSGEVTDVSCFNGSDGSIDITPTGGTPGPSGEYTYLWSNGVTTEDISGLTAGDYTVVVYDAEMCTTTGSFTVGQPVLLTVDGLPVDATCFDLCDGSITATPAGGTAPYTYLWNDPAGSTGATVYDLCNGTYSVTVTDFNGCTATGNWTVNEPTVVEVTGIPVNALCKDGCDGSIAITVTGGTGPYTFDWSNEATTQNVSDLCEGVYTVVVYDVNQCSATGSWTIGAPEALAVEGTPTAASCFDACDGLIDITVTGGTSPYTFIWSDPVGSTSEDISGLCAGDYFVTITDAHLCTLVDSWTLTEPGEVSWEGSLTDVSCNGVCDGTITQTFVIGGTPPYTYYWEGPNGFTSTDQDLTGLCAGHYELTVTDANSCDARAFRDITEPEVLVVDPVAVITPASCYNGGGGSIDITVSGGTSPYTYLWSNGETTEDIYYLTAGCYTVVVTDAQLCTATAQFCVGQPDPIEITGVPVDALCKGGCDGSIDISVTGGTGPYTFYWSNSATTEDVSDLCEGTYTVYVTDAHYCSAFQTFTVGAPDALAVEGTPTSASCYDQCDGMIDITVFGGTAPYTFVWSDPAGTTTEDVSGLCAGDYSVTITDAHLCTLVDSWTVTEPGEVSWEGSLTNVSCNGVCDGTITQTFVIGGTPPYTYYWEGPNGFTSTDQDLTGLCAGHYELTVTDSHSCDARAFRDITEPELLVVDPNAVIAPALCNGGTGGSIDITVTGGTTDYTYLWSNGETTEDIYNLTAGCYTVVVTDANLCTATNSFCVGQPDPIVIDGTVVDALCKGECNGSIDITVTGGTAPFSFYWTNGAYTEDVSDLCEGTYTVYVSDAHYCSAFQTFTVGAPDALAVEGEATPASCYDFCDGYINITPAGGTAPYTFVWSDPAGSTTQNVTGLCAGDYSVTITDAHLCTLVDSWTVTEPGEVSWEGSLTNVSCNGVCDGTITQTFVIGGTPPYTYYWEGPNGFTSTDQDLTGLCAGHYELTVTDSHSCDARAFRDITEPELLVVDPNAVIIPALCNGGPGGSIDITVTGGTQSYTYLWSNGETTEDIYNLTAGCYTVVVTDAQLCTATGVFCVGEPDPIEITGAPVDALCKLDCNGTIDITVIGGTGPYTYYWSNGAVTEDVSDLCEGTYYVTVTDSHTCVAHGNWTIGAPEFLQVTGEATPASCNSYCDGYINITPTGGTAPYTYVWSDPAGSTTQNVTGLCAGDYSVTITDAHLCTLVDSWTVTEPGEVSWEGSLTNVTCNGACDGTITQTFVIGGTPPYTYYWEGPNGFTSTNQDLTGLCAGHYELTVTDAHNCDARAFRDITEPVTLAILPDPILNHPLCNGDENGSIDITVNGGTLPYSFLWTNNETTENISGLAAGCYGVTVTDANNCTATGNWCLTEPEVLAATGVETGVLCKGDCNGSVDLTVTGGTLPYGYVWSNGSLIEDVSGLCEGTYYVTVTDAHSCEVQTSFTITSPDELVIGQPVVTNATCNGASNGTINGGIIPGVPPIILPIPVTGGTEPYTYLWSNGFTTDNLCCLTAGCYTVTVTDAHGCTTTGSWCIEEPPALSLTGTALPVLCNGDENGSIDITVSGGTPDYTYEWSNGATTEDLTGLTAGVYTVTVTDANGCPITGSWEVTTPEALTVTGVPTDILCNGNSTGSIDITVLGGTMPYTYYWSNGATTEDISDLPIGCYTVTVTDAHTCETVGSWCITEPEALALDAIVTDVDCYLAATGEIDLTVTGGVSPYTYLWSNGTVTEDLTGLTAGIYEVTVTDSHNCTITGSYEVLQPPAWWVDITGPSHACCNTPTPLDYYATVGGEEGYLGNCPPCETFQWTVVGGTITSGWNTNHITVVWDCCGQGTLSVVATKCDGCYVTDTKTVTIHLPPAPVISGPAGVTANSTVTYTTPYVQDHLYTWSVIGGSIVSGQGTNTITVTWGPYPPCGCGSVTVCETDTFLGCNNCVINGCTGCTTLNITIEPDPNSIQLQGYVYYKNDFNTALNGVTVKLRNTTTNTIVATVVTGPNLNSAGEPGYFSFDGIPAGNDYKLEASFNGTWGGNNATDALLVQLQAGGLLNPPLTGINWTAGDVNASTTITALDALYIKLRTVGSISSYPAGDWVFESPAVVIPTVPMTNIYGLCVGDVNGSYIPTGLKDVSFLSVIDTETQTIPVAETFEYQIRSSMAAQLGAMTLFMGYDDNRFEITDVTAPSNDEMKYVIENGHVAIAWADTKPLSVKNDDQLFTLTVKAKSPVTEATQVFNVKAGSEFASPNGTRFDNFDLRMDKVISVGSSKEFSVFNYPNPFSTTTKIMYTLPETAKVTLVITDLYGKTLRTLVNEVQSNGTYTIPVNAAELNLTSGVYLYRIDAAGETNSFVKVNKMIFTK